MTKRCQSIFCFVVLEKSNHWINFSGVLDPSKNKEGFSSSLKIAEG